jgi:hypothetical protein
MGENRRQAAALQIGRHGSYVPPDFLKDEQSAEL